MEDVGIDDGGLWMGLRRAARDAVFQVLPWRRDEYERDAADGAERSRSVGGSMRVKLDRLGTVMSGEDAESWSPSRYGEYYARSAPVHAAVRTLAEAVSRPTLRVWIRSSPSSDFEQAGLDHPMQTLLDRPNEFWSRGEMWRSVESRLALWGSAFIALGRDDRGAVNALWPLSPYDVRVLVSDDGRRVRGFIHETAEDRRAYLPEDVVWFRRFNPMSSFAGFSSLAPARAAVDMGSEALRFNRRFFMNSALPSDLVLLMDAPLSHDQLDEIYDGLDRRFQESSGAQRPIVLGSGMDMKRLGVSHREMEFVAALEWSVEEVARAFGVPKVFLSEFEDATLSNVRTMEQFLWRNTVIPELRMLEDGLNLHLAPHFAEFPGQLAARFDLSSIEAVQESATDRSRRLISLVKSGIMSVEEARGEMGLA